MLQVNWGEVMTLLNSFVGRIIVSKYAVLPELIYRGLVRGVSRVSIDTPRILNAALAFSRPRSSTR